MLFSFTFMKLQHCIQHTSRWCSGHKNFSKYCLYLDLKTYYGIVFTCVYFTSSATKHLIILGLIHLGLYTHCILYIMCNVNVR